MVTRGGARRPHKPAGRRPQRIGWQEFYWRQVHNGFGHNAEGNQVALNSNRRTSIELANGYGVDAV